MSVVATAADPSAALNKILRGNYQQAADAWAKIEPKLSGFAVGLAASIRRDDVEVMAFEYKRVEAFNRASAPCSTGSPRRSRTSRLSPASRISRRTRCARPATCTPSAR